MSDRSGVLGLQLFKSGALTTLRFFFAKTVMMSVIGIFRQPPCE